MFDIFPDQPSFEYPALVNIMYSLVWAFILSSVIAITHKLTYKGDHYPKNFFQAMVLGGIITAMVMMAIGDSLARGLGVFGAMAIIRFSTRINDPRDVLFLFGGLSTGLAIGVYGYSIAFAGTMAFCLAAFVLYFSKFRTSQTNVLTFSLENIDKIEAVKVIIHEFCDNAVLGNVAVNKLKLTRYEYLIELRPRAQKDQFLQKLISIEGIVQLSITDKELIDE